MTEKTEITSPIEIKDNSIERVAFDLMTKIASAEKLVSASTHLKPTPREYWLKLYNQCYKVIDYKDINIDKLLED